FLLVIGGPAHPQGAVPARQGGGRQMAAEGFQPGLGMGPAGDGSKVGARAGCIVIGLAAMVLEAQPGLQPVGGAVVQGEAQGGLPVGVVVPSAQVLVGAVVDAGGVEVGGSQGGTEALVPAAEVDLALADAMVAEARLNAG